MKTFREIAEMHYATEPSNEADKQYRLNRINALEKLLTEQCNVANVSKRSWQIGKKVVVTHCIHGHGFVNGTTVEIIEYSPSPTTSWLCSDGEFSWWLSEEEGYLI